MSIGDPAEGEQKLGDVVALIAGRLPQPTDPRAAEPPSPVPVDQHPFVRRVLAAFPGASIVSIREPDHG